MSYSDAVIFVHFVKRNCRPFVFELEDAFPARIVAICVDISSGSCR